MLCVVCFFYFKQKTAYEMRISDWSSDVALPILQELRYREQYDTLTGLYKKEKFVKEMKRLLKKYPAESFTMVHMDIYKFQLFNAFYGRNEEIGRASCRERVSQYV